MFAEIDDETLTFLNTDHTNDENEVQEGRQ